MVIPEGYFIFISVFVIAVYLLMIYLGYKKGFFSQLLDLCYTALSIFVSWLISPVLADLFPLFDIAAVNARYELLDQVFDLNSLLNTAAYFLIVFLILKLLYLFVSLIARSISKLPVIGSLNKILGAITGIFNATLIVLALSMLLSTPVVSNGAQVREKTVLKFISEYSDVALDKVIDLISENKLQGKVVDFDAEEYRKQLKEWLISVRENND
ncbi:MAG: CvpA family protein [Erysipelotrichaceae bacterium]|nr:CvpA family protein [Erysipelotrichaceae bacterium]